MFEAVLIREEHEGEGEWEEEEEQDESLTKGKKKNIIKKNPSKGYARTRCKNPKYQAVHNCLLAVGPRRSALPLRPLHPSTSLRAEN